MALLSGVILNPMHPARDAHLVQIVDAAAADSARRSGSFLRCAPGCTQCCIGVFPISQLDAARLRAGLGRLEAADPARAQALRRRAREAVARLAPDFPGDPETGILHPPQDPAEAARFDDFANDEPCPVLDPATGLCELYDARPVTCRVFGHPLRTGEGLGVCELCFEDATPDQIASCELRLDTAALESSLNAEVEQAAGLSGSTLIAWALITP